MPLTMHEISVPLFTQTLKGMSGVLDKAAAHYADKGLDISDLIQSRFAPDMMTLAQQVQQACHHATLVVSRLAQVDQPVLGDTDTTMDGLKARIATALDFLGSVPADAFEGSEDRRAEFQVRVGPVAFTGRDMLIHFAIPQVTFHATTMYGLVRHAGVEVGKQDFLHDAFGRRLS